MEGNASGLQCTEGSNDAEHSAVPRTAPHHQDFGHWPKVATVLVLRNPATGTTRMFGSQHEKDDSKGHLAI